VVAYESLERFREVKILPHWYIVTVETEKLVLGKIPYSRTSIKWPFSGTRQNRNSVQVLQYFVGLKASKSLD